MSFLDRLGLSLEEFRLAAAIAPAITRKTSIAVPSIVAAMRVVVTKR